MINIFLSYLILIDRLIFCHNRKLGTNIDLIYYLIIQEITYICCSVFSYDLANTIKRILELRITAITDCLYKIRINFTQMSEAD